MNVNESPNASNQIKLSTTLEPIVLKSSYSCQLLENRYTQIHLIQSQFIRIVLNDMNTMAYFESSWNWTWALDIHTHTTMKNEKFAISTNIRIEIEAMVKACIVDSFFFAVSKQTNLWLYEL